MTLFGENNEVEKLANEIFDCIRFPYSRDRNVTAYEAMQAVARVVNFIADNYESEEVIDG